MPLDRAGLGSQGGEKIAATVGFDLKLTDLEVGFCVPREKGDRCEHAG